MPGRRYLWAALAVAAALHITGLGYGLPHTFNSDEPHVVNMAVSFGAGSLKPYSFKYPSLWPTVLFFLYGLYFALWSGFGFLHSTAEFAANFAWDPTAFYWIARGTAAAGGLAAVGVLWRAERSLRLEGLPWGALLLAFSPVVIEQAHTAKPDSLMLLWCAVAWLGALGMVREGFRRQYWLCGAALGLAVSTQYTAAGAALLLPLAHVLGRARSGAPARWLAEGLGLACLCFFLGSPYIFLDFQRFRATLQDFSALAGIQELSRAQTTRGVLLNMWNFAGEGSVAGLALLAGCWRLWRRDPRLAVLVAVPAAAYFAALANHPDGLWMRYLLACFPGLALAAGEGLAWVAGRGRWAAAAAMILGAGPGAWEGWRQDRLLLLPDTRTEARRWIDAAVPAGATVLADYPHASPFLRPSREQLEELAGRTQAAGSPRWRLYQAMAATHPGGGYRVLRIRRSAADLRSNPKHVETSQAEGDFIDVRGGMEALRTAGVSHVVTSSFGAVPSRAKELGRFFDDLHARGRLAREFAPVPGRVAGPHLRVFLLSYNTQP